MENEPLVKRECPTCDLFPKVSVNGVRLFLLKLPFSSWLTGPTGKPTVFGIPLDLDNFGHGGAEHMLSLRGRGAGGAAGCGAGSASMDSTPLQTQLPSGAPFSFFWGRGSDSFKLNQPKIQDAFFPRGHWAFEQTPTASCWFEQAL